VGETPNPKHQAPEKSQAPNPKRRLDTAILELGIWGLFGAWILVFGVFIPVFGAWFLEFSFFVIRHSRVTF